MAVSFGGGTIVNGASPLAFSLNPSGSNVVMYVGISHAPGAGADPSAATATWHSAAQSFTTKFTDITTNGSRQIRVQRLLNPDQGSFSGEVTWSGGGHMRVIAFWLTGVDQVTPDDAQDTFDGGSGVTSTTHTIASAVGNLVVDFAVSPNSITNFNAAGGQTEIAKSTTDGGGAGLNSQGASYEPGAASVGMGWSWTETVSAVGWAFDVNAAAAVAADPPQRTKFVRGKRPNKLRRAA